MGVVAALAGGLLGSRPTPRSQAGTPSELETFDFVSARRALKIDFGREQDIRSYDGVRIRCLVSGEGPAMLFIPGWMVPAEVWKHQITFFRDRYKVVAIEIRTNAAPGIVDSAESFSLESIAKDIHAVLTRLKLTQVVAVGWSLGVSDLGAYLSLYGSQHLAGLCFVDGNVAGTTASEANSLLTTLRSLKTSRKLWKDNIRPIYESMFRQQGEPAFRKYIIERAFHVPPEAAYELFEASLLRDCRAALGRCNVPVLNVVNTGPGALNSNFSSNQEMTKILNALRPGSAEEIDFTSPACGHAIFIDEKERFNSLVLGFMQKIPSHRLGTPEQVRASPAFQCLAMP